MAQDTDPRGASYLTRLQQARDAKRDSSSRVPEMNRSIEDALRDVNLQLGPRTARTGSLSGRAGASTAALQSATLQAENSRRVSSISKKMIQDSLAWVNNPVSTLSASSAASTPASYTRAPYGGAHVPTAAAEGDTPEFNMRSATASGAHVASAAETGWAPPQPGAAKQPDAAHISSAIHRSLGLLGVDPQQQQQQPAGGDRDGVSAALRRTELLQRRMQEKAAEIQRNREAALSGLPYGRHQQQQQQQQVPPMQQPPAVAPAAATPPATRRLVFSDTPEVGRRQHVDPQQQQQQQQVVSATPPHDAADEPVVMLGVPGFSSDPRRDVSGSPISINTTDICLRQARAEEDAKWERLRASIDDAQAAAPLQPQQRDMQRLLQLHDEHLADVQRIQMCEVGLLLERRVFSEKLRRIREYAQRRAQELRMSKFPLHDEGIFIDAVISVIQLRKDK